MIVSIGNSLFAAAGVIAHLFLTDTQGREFFQLLSLVLVSVCSLAVAVGVYVRTQKRERYARAFELVHLAVHAIRDELQRTLPDGDDEDARNQSIKDCVEAVLNCLSIGFSMITGGRCRATLKTLEVDVPQELKGKTLDDGDLAKYGKVVTFCRDPITSQLIAENDLGSSIDLQENDRFFDLYKSSRTRFWINNDVKLDNSRRTKPEKYGSCLPYSSQMIWPIRHTRKGKADANHAKRVTLKEQDLIGFLIVDSPEKNCFNKLFDFDVGAIVADALYIYLDSVQPKK
ncbi:hypothetical protein K227x_53320 [Rubripirellula lacrimiformis]|uniref:GAF domain-containing protein n=1 Tax=Rubripirellula lacrimiformis TaxID=1930273 RepID=A0A517NIF1_9BACT|nr:hypothetical protein [Rubripirellula lacrimiformis]QDT06909.1 hypothetical protein K227x_53320 [Rubripirellula lacrimiformis]